MTTNDLDRAIRAAEQRNQERDAIDAAYGFATPAAVGEREFLMTVDAALDTGLRMDDSSCVAEALVMVRHRLRFFGDPVTGGDA